MSNIDNRLREEVLELLIGLYPWVTMAPLEQMATDLYAALDGLCHEPPNLTGFDGFAPRWAPKLALSGFDQDGVVHPPTVTPG